MFVSLAFIWPVIRGEDLWPANSANVSTGVAEVEAMTTENGVGNGGEAAALVSTLAALLLPVAPVYCGVMIRLGFE